MSINYSAWALSLLLLVAFASCRTAADDRIQEDQVIAQVGDRKLFAKELNQVIHPGISTTDSTALANAYIDQWVRDKLLMREAARSFSSDFEVENLVEDYREKLLKFKLEEMILDQRYDTIVTQNQLESFYEEQKSGFILDQALYRCWLVKFPQGLEDGRTFRQDWRNNNLEGIKSFIENDQVESVLDTNRWFSWDEIENWCPTFEKRRAKTVKDQRKIRQNTEFYLKVHEVVDEGDFSPLEYVELQMKLMILLKRKQDIIEDYKQELYNKAIEANTVKI